MTELIVLMYENKEKGLEVLNEIGRLQKAQLIEVADAALAVKDEKGKVKVTQTLEKMHTGAVAMWGGFWGLLIGLLFGGPIFWALFGGLMGGIIGKKTDLGIDNKFIKEVSESMEPGNSALFVMVIEATVDKVLPELQKFGGTVFQTSLSQEDEDKLRMALEHEDVAEAALESAELSDES